MKKLLLTFVTIVLLSGCSGPAKSTESRIIEDNDWNTNYVDIKYRDDPVDLENGSFDYFDTSASSWVEGAWYDSSNKYMVINLNGVYYHYCGMPYSVWTDFESTDSIGSHYHEYIKGNYDCRYNYVPSY